MFVAGWRLVRVARSRWGACCVGVGGLPPGAVSSAGCVHCRYVLGVAALVTLQWCLDEQFSALALASLLVPAVQAHSFLSVSVACGVPGVPATQNRMCQRVLAEGTSCPVSSLAP